MRERETGTERKHPTERASESVRVRVAPTTWIKIDFLNLHMTWPHLCVSKGRSKLPQLTMARAPPSLKCTSPFQRGALRLTMLLLMLQLLLIVAVGLPEPVIADDMLSRRDRALPSVSPSLSPLLSLLPLPTGTMFSTLSNVVVLLLEEGPSAAEAARGSTVHQPLLAHRHSSCRLLVESPVCNTVYCK